MSRDSKLTIIAGSHTVIHACEAYYSSSGLSEEIIKEHLGESISPIFMPNGNTQYQCKLGKSIFEISMNLPEKPQVKTFNCLTKSGIEYPFSVLLCIDALEMKNVGLVDELATKLDEKGYLLISPSFSPSTEGFYDVARTLDLRGITLLYCNTAEYGSSGVYLNKNVSFRYKVQGDAKCVATEKKEQIVEITFRPEENFALRGRIDNRVIGNFNIIPIFYNNEFNWIKNFQETFVQVQGYIQEDDIYNAENILDSFLMFNQQNIVPEMSKQITDFYQKMMRFPLMMNIK